jgi:subtilase family serine protease
MGLSKTAQQQKDLDRLLNDIQNLKSLQYHQWLTPEQYAGRFGLSQGDLDKITAWLQGAGFQVLTVSRGRDAVTFSGTASQVEQVFQAPIHLYRVNGEVHFANSAALLLPKDLASVVAGIHGLTDFAPKPPRRRVIRRLKKADTSANSNPQLVDPQGDTFLVPDDFAAIYDITGLYSSGNTGAGMKIAVVGGSDISMSDIEGFRSAFNLPFNDPVKVLAQTPNPGMNSAMDEADLDLEWAGAMAPDAKVYYVFASDPMIAMFYAIDQDLAPILSTSLGVCEWHLISNDFALFHSYSQKAAAEGITWVSSSGDAGAAGCENQNGPWLAATTRMSVDMPASLPEVTGVGGTEFNEGTGTYYSSKPGPSGGTAMGYIPELAWSDEGIIVQNIGLFGSLQEEGMFSASGGGASIWWPKPSWQAGPGVPQDGARDVPDVAFNASGFHDPYVVSTGGNFVEVGGTSAATPLFAGILAIINQYLVASKVQAQPGLGNINPMLYYLGQNYASVYHDVTQGSNTVPCVPNSTQDCGSSATYGYTAGPAYDQVTGWGSVDAGKLASTWAKVAGNSATLVYDITTKQIFNGSCSRTYYQQASWFLPTDPSANVYLEVNNVASTDQLTDQWIRPDGTVYATNSWSSATGNRCYADSVNIAGAAPVNSPGTWHARVFLNGSVLFDLPFTITPVQLTNSMMTKSVNSSGCTTPTPTTAFSVSDQNAYLWFSVSGANAGDVGAVNWLAPGGTSYASGSWNALSAAGSYCFWWNIPIAGANAANLPGNWNVQTTWNGYPLFTLQFTITKP